MRACSASLRVSPRLSSRNRARNSSGSKAGLMPVGSRRCRSRRTSVKASVNQRTTWNRSNT